MVHSLALVAITAASLAGHWTLSRANGVKIDYDPAPIMIVEKDIVRAQSFCSSFTSHQYSVESGELIISRRDSMTIMRRCFDKAGQPRSDEIYRKILFSKPKIRLRGDKLTLTSEDGMSLEFRHDNP